MTKINAKKILEELEGKDDRKPVSLYLSISLYKRFRKNCGKASMSKVVEKLIEQFCDNAELD